MTLNERYKTIVQFANKHDNKITKKEACDLIGNSYYHNAEKYVGETLSRMVKSKILKRIKPGYFELLNESKQVKLL